MELAARLPVGQKLRHGQKKHLLRRAFHDLLPKENVRRRKMGFGVPVGEWFRGPMRELVEDALLGGESAARGLVDPATAGRLLNDHIERRGDHTSLLWNLLMLELWHREVVDGRFSERR
jgi:asparagine synthase (glutamine-hydrolysing)